MRRLVAGLTVLALAVAGVVLLRSELMTVHTPMPPGSRTEFLVEADTEEHPRHLTEMTRGLVSVCRLLVNADVVEQSFTPVRPDVFSFTLTPGLDEFDVREMRGCLQDTRVQNLLVQVREVRTTGTRPT
jgi:hypothetical protein